MQKYNPMQNPPDYRHDTVLPLPMEVRADAWAVDAACSGNPDQRDYQPMVWQQEPVYSHFDP
jgi:ribonuclease HI